MCTAPAGFFIESEGGPLQPLPLTERSELRGSRQTYPPAQIERLKSVFGWLDDDYDKIAVEREVLSNVDLPGTVLRLPMVYGPGDHLHRVGEVLARLRGSTVVTLEAGQAAWRGPRGYVDNVGDAIALAAVSQRAANRVYNLAEPEHLSALEWMQVIATRANWQGTFSNVPAERATTHLSSAANFDQHWVVDSTRIREELGYREGVSRDDAIAHSIAWEEGTRV